jgi:hypothetical protein
VVVQHSVHIDLPVEAISSSLYMDPSRWFPRLEGLSRTAMSPGVAGIGPWGKLDVEVGEPVSAGSRTEVPVIWHAAYIKHLYPVMTGNVELAAVSDRVTRLTVCADYEPPVGRLGEQIEDPLLHEVAQATVKDLAESIARLLDGGVQ